MTGLTLQGARTWAIWLETLSAARLALVTSSDPLSEHDDDRPSNAGDGARTLVLMRHARAEDAGASDSLRQLSSSGRRDAAAAGRWLAARGLRPDHALVSSAVRTRQTWEQLCVGAGWSLEPELDRGMYEAGTEAALDLVRLVASEVSTLVVVGHNPTVASLAQLLDDGEGDQEAAMGLLTGYPTAAITVYAVDTAWADLGEQTATVRAHHVARA